MQICPNLKSQMSNLKWANFPSPLLNSVSILIAWRIPLLPSTISLCVHACHWTSPTIPYVLLWEKWPLITLNSLFTSERMTPEWCRLWKRVKWLLSGCRWLKSRLRLIRPSSFVRSICRRTYYAALQLCVRSKRSTYIAICIILYATERRTISSSMSYVRCWMVRRLSLSYAAMRS